MNFFSDFNKIDASFSINNGSISGNIIYDYFFDDPWKPLWKYTKRYIYDSFQYDFRIVVIFFKKSMKQTNSALRYIKAPFKKILIKIYSLKILCIKVISFKGTTVIARWCVKRSIRAE